MKRVTLIATALVLAVVAVLTTKVWAQETNTHEITYLTFSNAVELPGVTLPAGTYTFRLADTPSRNVVQVLDRDQKNIMGQWLFVQAERPEVTGDTVIMFKESREGATPAVQYWYFPGEKIGKEFIYPKDQAQKIAARTGQRVRTEEGYVTSDTAVSSTDAQGQTSQWQKEGSPAAAANNNDQNAVQGLTADASASRQDQDRDAAVTHNQVESDNNNSAAVGTSGSSPDRAVGTSGSDRASNNQSAVPADTGSAQASNRAELPKTGSELPLAGLIGLLALAGALGTRAVATVRR
jgi:LPXTG-motif cell wall-anchored protein